MTRSSGLRRYEARYGECGWVHEQADGRVYWGHGHPATMVDRLLRRGAVKVWRAEHHDMPEPSMKNLRLVARMATVR